MTVSTEPTPLSYSGDDATVNFPITWKYIAKAHVVATLRSSTGTETVWVLDTDYTLTDPASTGTLTATTAPASGQTLVITLEPPNTQLSSFPLGGDFPSTTVEQALDLCAQRDGRLEALLNRAMLVPVTDSRTGSNLTLPVDTDRASKFLAFDGDGDPIAAAGTSANLTPVSVYMNTLLDDASDADARTTLGAGATGSTLFTAATPASARSTLSVPSISEITGRNRLKNGCFRVSQRYGTTATSTADDVYMMDCWYGLSQTGACTHQQVMHSSSPLYQTLEMTQGIASAQRFGCAQIIESKDCVDLNGKDVVFSCKVYSDPTTTIRCAILSWTGTADAVTSDVVNDWTSSTYTAGNFFNSTTLEVVAVGSVSAAGNMEATLTATGLVNTTTMKNLVVVVWTESAQVQNYKFSIGQCQLELGSVATLFEYEDYGFTLRKCQRYFYAHNFTHTGTSGYWFPGTCISTTHANIGVSLPVPIRVPYAGTSSISIGAAGSFQVMGSSGSPIAVTALVLKSGMVTSNQFVMLDATVASGLTAGDGTFLGGGSMSTDHIWFIGSEM